jgi:threonine/homoserine/homoserine lactone efflux protein
LLDWTRVLAGAAMIGLAARKWHARRRREGDPALPKWMSSLTSMVPGRAFVLGLTLAAVNPKNLVLAVSAAGSITDVGGDRGDAVLGGLLFVAIGASAIVGLLVVRLLGGDRATAALTGVEHFMLANNDVIVMVVLLLLGASVLGDGLAHLTV